MAFQRSRLSAGCSPLRKRRWLSVLHLSVTASGSACAESSEPESSTTPDAAGTSLLRPREQRTLQAPGAVSAGTPRGCDTGASRAPQTWLRGQVEKQICFCSEKPLLPRARLPVLCPLPPHGWEQDPLCAGSPSPAAVGAPAQHRPRLAQRQSCPQRPKAPKREGRPHRASGRPCPEQQGLPVPQPPTPASPLCQPVLHRPGLRCPCRPPVPTRNGALTGFSPPSSQTRAPLQLR